MSPLCSYPSIYRRPFSATNAAAAAAVATNCCTDADAHTCPVRVTVLLLLLLLLLLLWPPNQVSPYTGTPPVPNNPFFCDFLFDPPNSRLVTTFFYTAHQIHRLQPQAQQSGKQRSDCPETPRREGSCVLGCTRYFYFLSSFSRSAYYFLFWFLSFIRSVCRACLFSFPFHPPADW